MRLLPAGFFYPRQLTGTGQFPKAYPANVKLPHIAVLPAATPTTPDDPGGKFGSFFCSGFY